MREVVVIGGGVAGIQAALDLANHGIIVHLVEREPTIGGHMRASHARDRGSNPLSSTLF